MPLVAAIAVGAWWGFTRSDGSGATTNTPSTATVTRGNLSRTVSASGTVAAAHTDDLSFSTGGTVTAVNVKAGDTVTKGQVLASIDPGQLQAAVSSAQASLASAQAQLSDDSSAGASAAQIAADNASVTTAQDHLDQANPDLAGANLVATFDGTVATVDLTVGEQLASSGAGGTSSTGTASGSGRSANDLGSSSQGTAGFGGGGSGASTTSGSPASSNSSDPQIEVISSGHYTVTLDVSSSDVANVKAGQSATVSLSSATSSNSRLSQFLAQFGGGLRSSNTATGQGSSSQAASVSGTDATGKVTSVGAVADASSGVATYPVVVTFTGRPRRINPERP